MLPFLKGNCCRPFSWLCECGHLMLIALNYGSTGPGSSPGRGLNVVFLGKILYPIVPLSSRVYEYNSMSAILQTLLVDLNPLLLQPKHWELYTTGRVVPLTISVMDQKRKVHWSVVKNWCKKITCIKLSKFFPSGNAGYASVSISTKVICWQ